MLNDIYQSLDPVAFQIGDYVVRWYGLAYVVGFVCAGLVFALTAKRWKITIDIDRFLLGIIVGILCMLIGARLGYCIFYGDGYYFVNPLKILAIYEGGMSFHGGLIGGIIAAIPAAKIMQVPFLRTLDLAFIGVPIGLFFGRCANFINGELWGAPTDLPWAVNFGSLAGNVARHPSQLYEAILEGLVLFAILFILSRKVPPYRKGTYFAVFCILYGIFRFLVEFVRVPDSQLGYLAWDWLTMGQLLTIPVILLGLCILIYNFKKGIKSSE